MTLNEAWIERTFISYSDMVLRIALQNVKNMTIAEDIVQEVFLRLMQQTIPDQFSKSNTEYIKAWLIRVTINLCHDHYRSSWIRHNILKNEISDTNELPWQNEVQKEVYQSLYKLKPKDRNILYLYYIEGYSIMEISNLLHIKSNTIGSSLRRARQKLKLILDDEE